MAFDFSGIPCQGQRPLPATLLQIASNELGSFSPAGNDWCIAQQALGAS